MRRTTQRAQRYGHRVSIETRIDTAGLRKRGWMLEVGCAASVSAQYETLFRQNDIDAEVLSELTDDDLEKFGVSFGHRKRLLKAIASLGSTETAAKPANP